MLLTVTPNLKQRPTLMVFFVFFCRWHLSAALETLIKTCAILQIDLVSLKPIGGKK